MKLFFLPVLAAFLSSPLSAQPTMTTVSVKGPGSWEMICHISSRFGDEVVALDTARGSFARSDFYRAACDTSSSGSGPLAVSISGPMPCPFKSAAAGSCQQSFKGGVASFVIKTK